jgi:hypothetical protein
MKRKSDQAEEMFQNLVNEMNNAMGVKVTRDHTKKIEFPSFLGGTNGSN